MTMRSTARRAGWHSAVFLGLGLTALTGCEQVADFNPFKPNPNATATAATAGSSVKLVERDVEAPHVFQVTDMGLWDGRPSLGGVWVAHPDVKEPERVIIRNTENSKFVIGALFRRERANPGPVLQVSSDAAAALGLLAGAPAQLNVTALRREAAPQPAPETAPEPASAETKDIAKPGDIETSTLDPVAGAAAAIEKAEANAKKPDAKEPDAGKTAKATKPAKSAAAKPAPAKPAPAKKRPSLEKPFIQIGIFSVEQNARNTATAMRQAGMVPTVKAQSTQGKKFWRVIVGPAATKSDRNVLLKKIKGVGFEDAYPVTN